MSSGDDVRNASLVCKEFSELIKKNRNLQKLRFFDSLLTRKISVELMMESEELVPPEGEGSRNSLAIYIQERP